MEISIDNIEDIKELIALTECEKIEFKETTGQLDRGMETLCAFLNGHGYGENNYISTTQVLHKHYTSPIFPDQLRSPKQKYRLTEKGKALLTKKS